MQIQVITVGKLKERFLREGVAEYLKRLRPYTKLKVIEVAEEKLRDPLRPAEINKVIEKEGERLLYHLSSDQYIIALAIEGVSYTSDQLAQHLQKLATYGNSRISFLIGGSMGLSPAVLARADLKLSLSAMTFPHQLARLILLEQIYRSFKINHGETYHK